MEIYFVKVDWEGDGREIYRASHRAATVIVTENQGRFSVYLKQHGEISASFEMHREDAAILLAETMIFSIRCI